MKYPSQAHTFGHLLPAGGAPWGGCGIFIRRWGLMRGSGPLWGGP